MDVDSKKIWIRSLKVGDIVCDCRYKHVAILSLKEEWAPIRLEWIRNIIGAKWMPNCIFDFLDMLYEKICIKFNYMEVVDKDLILEDGSGCSAMCCCDSPDHTWSHDKDYCDEFSEEEG
jgi:hypothetical protein